LHVEACTKDAGTTSGTGKVADMIAGQTGTFVISWAQTQLDGHWNAPPAGLAVGATWFWTGEAVRLDGPAEVPAPVADAEGTADLRRRAAVQVRRMLRAAVPNPVPNLVPDPATTLDIQ